MANTKSARKRVRSDAKKKLRNQYQHKTTRTFVKKLFMTKEVKTALEKFPKVIAMLHKLVKRGIIHKNKSSRIQSSLAAHVNKLART